MTKLKELIQIIGKKRSIFLGVLLVFTILLAGIWQKWTDPQHEDLLKEKSTVEADRTRLQREKTELPIKYKELKENEARYEAILNTGFMTNQDRIVARSDIEAIRMRTGLRGISYNISPQESVTDAQAGDYNVVRTKIDFEMKGLTDLEMRDFVDRMTKDFRGIVALKELLLKRENDVTDSKLMELTNKRAVDFTTGKARFEWYTIISKSGDDKAGPPKK